MARHYSSTAGTVPAGLGEGMASIAQNDCSAPVKTWWTEREIADHYGFSVRSVYDAIASGRLPVHRCGQGHGGIRVADQDRLNWEAACREHRTPQSAGVTSEPQPIRRLRWWRSTLGHGIHVVQTLSQMLVDAANHCCVAVTHQFRNRDRVVAAFEGIRREGMPEKKGATC